ncbi:MAG: hypothetical protein ACE5GY_09950, partial [Thermodesulfobacteriota bacterium]
NASNEMARLATELKDLVANFTIAGEHSGGQGPTTARNIPSRERKLRVIEGSSSHEAVTRLASND